MNAEAVRELETQLDNERTGDAARPRTSDPVIDPVFVDVLREMVYKTAIAKIAEIGAPDELRKLLEVYESLTAYIDMRNTKSRVAAYWGIDTGIMEALEAITAAGGDFTEMYQD
jgi:hypothetical protein